jgi:hypothetical protein
MGTDRKPLSPRGYRPRSGQPTAMAQRTATAEESSHGLGARRMEGIRLPIVSMSRSLWTAPAAQTRPGRLPRSGTRHSRHRVPPLSDLPCRPWLSCREERDEPSNILIHLAHRT